MPTDSLEFCIYFFSTLVYGSSLLFYAEHVIDINKFVYLEVVRTVMFISVVDFFPTYEGMCFNL